MNNKKETIQIVDLQIINPKVQCLPLLCIFRQGIFLVVQWLKLCAPSEEAWVQYLLVRELDSTHLN